MSSTPDLTTQFTDSTTATSSLSHLRATVSWPAIFAGFFAALSLEFLFMLLGSGLGFAIYTPLTDENPVASLGAGAVAIEGISAVFSLWFGGWIAGRFTPMGTRLTGGIHGFLVWSVATIAGILFVSAGAGWAVGGLSKMVGGGLSLAGKPAAAAVGGASGDTSDLAKSALKQSTDTMSSYVDEAVASPASGAAPGTAVRAKREIGLAVARYFNPSKSNNVTETRTALIKSLVDNAGMSEADATRTVTEWTASYDRLKADLATAKSEAEAKARVAAEEASHALSLFSFCAFGALALGAIAAVFGGEHGGECAIRRHNRPELVP
jgi:hypothetical protein